MTEASRLIEHATEQLVDLALDVNDIETARGAITQGLRGLPGDEVLYRLRMRVEHHAGNLPGVTAAYDELLRYLVEFDAEPSPSTVELVSSSSDGWRGNDYIRRVGLAERHMDEDKFNISVRKFLKQVGVTSQREIERIVREGYLSGPKLKVRMVLTAEGTGLNHVIEEEIDIA